MKKSTRYKILGWTWVIVGLGLSASAPFMTLDNGSTAMIWKFIAVGLFSIGWGRKQIKKAKEYRADEREQELSRQHYIVELRDSKTGKLIM